MTSDGHDQRPGAPSPAVPSVQGLAGAVGLDRGPLHLAVGMFDGVHLGHRAVIEAAVLSAQSSHGIAAALTFDPHPSRLLRASDPVRLIQSLDTRCAHLRACGVAVVIVEPFRAELAAIEAEALLPHIRQHLPQLSTIYVGENWRFGRGRRGDVNLLVAEARRLGLSVVSAPRIKLNGEPISSTRIRAALEAGEIRDANLLLGYTYASSGEVIPGKRLGRTLGFPTLNLAWTPECRPRHGVYALRVTGPTGAGLAAVGNYGLRPTVEQTLEPRLEVHVLGDCPFDTGDQVTVEWLEFIRPEQRFAGIEELRAQIQRDVETARGIHARLP